MIMENRPKIGVVIDYSIRVPVFTECYRTLKEEVIVGMPAGVHVDFNDNASLYSDMTPTEIAEHKAQEVANKPFDQRNFWHGLNNSNPEAANFYLKNSLPKLEQPDFDITFDKYFFIKEHKLRFLNEYSYAIYGQGSVTNKADVEIINIAQTKLCDVVLIDITQHTRKVPNTFAFLSRSGIFVKEVRFVGASKMEEDTKDLVSVWNPYEKRERIITPSTVQGQPTEKFITWFEQIEKDIKK